MMELAALYGTTDRTLRRWKAEGVDITSKEAVEAYRATLQSRKAIGPIDSKGLREEKLKADTREKIAKAELAEIQLAKAKGEVVRVEDMAEIYLSVASAVKAQLLRLEGELPGALEGLAAAAMVPIIRDKTESILGYLAENLGHGTEALGATAGESRAALHAEDQNP